MAEEQTVGDVIEPIRADAPEVGAYGFDDVLITAGGQTRTLQDWMPLGADAKTTKVTSLDGKTVFEFDDPTGCPGDVVVYVAGRPAP